MKNYLNTADNLLGMRPLLAWALLLMAFSSQAQGQYKWYRTNNSFSDDLLSEVRTDSAGNTYFLGHFTGPGSSGFGGFSSTSYGGRDAVVGKIAADGTTLWYKNIGTANDDTARIFFNKANGHVFVMGIAMAPLVFDGSTHFLPAGSSRVLYVVELSSSGSFIGVDWVASGAGLRLPDRNGLAVDAGGNLIVTATKIGTVKLGPYTLAAPPSRQDVFVAKITPIGVVAWHHETNAGTPPTSDCSCTPRVAAHSIALDPSGNIYLLGQYYGRFTYPGLGLDSVRLEDQSGLYAELNTFVIKMNSSGLGGYSEDINFWVDPVGIQISNTGNVAIGLTAGGGPLVAQYHLSSVRTYLASANPATMPFQAAWDPTGSVNDDNYQHYGIYDLSWATNGTLLVSCMHTNHPTAYGDDDRPFHAIRRYANSGSLYISDSLSFTFKPVYVAAVQATGWSIGTYLQDYDPAFYMKGQGTFKNNYPDGDMLVARYGNPAPILGPASNVTLSKASLQSTFISGQYVKDYYKVTVAGIPTTAAIRGNNPTGTTDPLYVTIPEGVPLGTSPVVVTTPDGMDTTYVTITEPSDWDWVRRINGPSFDRMNKAAYDRFQNTYAVGSFVGSTVVDITTSTTLPQTATTSSTRQTLINRYNPTGQLLWSLNASATGTAGENEAWDCALHNDSLFVVGYFKGTITFSSIGGSPQTLISAGGKDIFLVKYAPSGKCLWALRFGGTSDDEAWDINVSRTGKAYIAGNFSNTITFSGRPGATGGNASVNKTSAGGTDAFLVKFMANGALDWVVTAGGAGNDIAYGIQQSPSQDVYFCGQFEQTATVTPTSGGVWTLTSAGSSDGFVGQMGFGGTVRWLRRMGGTGQDVCRQIAVDKNANNCIVGYFNSPSMTIQSGSAPGVNASTVLATAGSNDAFSVSYNDAGTFRYGRRFGGSLDDQGRSITVDQNGFFLMAGYFAGTANDGAAIQHSSANNSSDLFLWQLYPSGNSYLITRSGGNNSEQGRGVDTAASGGVTVVGQYGQNAYFGTYGPYAESGSGGGFVAKFGGVLSPGLRQGEDTQTLFGSDKATIRLYPNPASNSVTLMVQGIGFASGSILDAQGRVAMQFQGKEGQSMLDIRSLPQGLYHVVLKDDTGKSASTSLMKE